MTIPSYLQNHSGTVPTGTYKQLIDGKLVDGASSIDVVDPALGSAFGRAAVADRAQVNAAVAAAKRAFPAWKKTSYEERGAILDKLADAIEQNAEHIARLTTREQGKPLSEAAGDTAYSAVFARWFAAWRPEREIVQDDANGHVEIQRVPLGVVALITPWNFPFLQAVYKIAPALMTGNTVVLKPSPTTPLNTLLLAALLQPLVPPGVVNIVGDGGDVGPLLTSHPDVAKVSFTGSTLTGKHVMASAAEGIKRVTLELGGNDSAIVMPDADPKKAGPAIAQLALMNAGQICISIKRIFIPNAIKAAFEGEMVKFANTIKVGPGLDPGVTMGPLQNKKQYDAIRGALDIARSSGKVLVGGDVHGHNGYFVKPTLVTNIKDDSRLVAEETFGPVRTTFGYDSLDEAVARANATPYGLGNSVWGTDLEAAVGVANRLDSGTVWVNQHLAFAPNVPFGGQKHSGIGSEFGEDGIRTFTNVRVINVKKG